MEKEDIEDDDFSPLSNLWRSEDDSDDNESTEMSFEFKGKTICLKVAENDGTIPVTLFACNVWNGSIQVASYLAENDETIRGKAVVEVGAGAAFPSLVALAFGATKTVITDYPNQKVLANIEDNLARNTHVLGDIEDKAFVQSHIWGSDTGNLVALLGEQYGGFDILLAAECLWLHDQHEALLTSIQSLLKPGGKALISFSHHIPNCEQKDLHFFEIAESSSFNFKVDQVATDTMQHMFSEHKTVQQYLYVLEKCDCK
mmetsp:Transcript_1112/g.1575  ORF Transcript_1112/g.1575 Transcript_1112/m.1575 type:complete len:258 (+) Transcript_1112:124-897(+)